MSEEEIAKALGSPKEVADEYLKGDFASLITPKRGFRHWVLLIILVIASPFIALLTLIGVAIIFCFIFAALIVLAYYAVGLPLSILRSDWFNSATVRLYFFQSAPPLVKLIAGCLAAFALLIFLKYTVHLFDYLMDRLRRCWLH